jgi:hypothetical protein
MDSITTRFFARGRRNLLRGGRISRWAVLNS